MRLNSEGARITRIITGKRKRVKGNRSFSDAFAAACTGLGSKTDLADLAERYGLKELKPICGFNAPNTIDLRHIRD